MLQPTQPARREVTQLKAESGELSAIFVTLIKRAEQ